MRSLNTSFLDEDKLLANPQEYVDSDVSNDYRWYANRDQCEHNHPSIVRPVTDTYFLRPFLRMRFTPLRNIIWKSECSMEEVCRALDPCKEVDQARFKYSWVSQLVVIGTQIVK